MKLFAKMLVLSFLVFIFSCGTAGKDIGISKIVQHPALDAVEKGVQDELLAQGFDKLTFDLQNANGDLNTAAQIANKFKSQKVKVAVGIATPTAQALVNNLQNIPVVFSAVTDPAGAGLVKSVSMGEPNVTGVSDMTPVEEQIRMLVSIKPVKKIGNIYTASEANSVTLANILKEVCKKMNIEYIDTSVANSSEVKQAAESIVSKVDAIYVGTDNNVVSALNSVLEVANNKKIPVISADPSSSETLPVFAAYGFNYYSMGRVTGRIVADILNGKKAEEIPTVYMTDPADLDLVLNLDVAKQIGITIPPEILQKATMIVENGQVVKKKE